MGFARNRIVITVAAYLQSARKRFQHNLAEFKTLLDLTPFLNTPVRSLSWGSVGALIYALHCCMTRPAFPRRTDDWLDVVAKERMRQFVKHMNRERGTTILFDHHDLADVQKLCESALIIDQASCCMTAV